ncbi:unnamed protein product [Adineta steineri]|uniref:Metalloendopeptidase n=1 Tax=Adineta steineri TaxID=433720 RepID=A0A813XU83_9BILA|nr:unnamed protein product [Adineta steineri]CAF3616006.1 unnamed protein product [Adineta steineri]
MQLEIEGITIDLNDSSIDMMNVTVFAGWIFAIIIANVCAIPTVEVFNKDPPDNKQNLEQIPDVIEGDIIRLPKSRKARGLARVGNNIRWTDGIVPYEFISGYTVEQQAEIVTRMRKLENLVAINNARCIQFRPRVCGDLYYLKLQNGEGCQSTAGQTGAEGYLMLAYPLCFDDGRIFHEFLHALGIYHEQSRSDRDSYVRVYPENIQTEMNQQFLIRNKTIADTFNSSYDYASVMHYGTYDGSKDHLPTIEPIQSNIKIGQRYTLSNGDIQLIRRYYNCSSNGPTLPPFTVPIEPAFENATTSTYSSELTNQDLMYARNGSSATNFYYEVIRISVTTAGPYIFQCNSNIDTIAYTYKQTFNPLKPAENLITVFDDEDFERWEFRISRTFYAPSIILLVVTTYSPNITGPFLIVASGDAQVIFNRTVGTVSPTTSNSTSAKTTTYSASDLTMTTTNSLFNIGRWSTTGSLSISRISDTSRSTLLSDGRVITTGGIEGDSTVELYNPVTRTWNRGASMNSARIYHTATLLPDGRLFVTGGWDLNTHGETAEIYNPVTNIWTAVSNMTFGRYGHEAVYLPAPINKIFVIGGRGYSFEHFYLQECELYDFDSNKWTTTTSMINK